MSIGFRCWPDKLAYVVAVGRRSNPSIVEAGVRKFPADLSRAGFLNWVTKEIKAIVARHQTMMVAYKQIEPTAQKNQSLLRRAEVEGVVQAVLYEAGCRDIKSFSKQQLKSQFGFSGSAADVNHVLRGMCEVAKDTEEAALAAIALLAE